MRSIIWNNEEIDLTCCADLSENWDKNHPQDDTEFLIINANVLGNAAGKKAIDGDDTSSAWAAVHGRKYNNARVAIPFTRKFVTEHYAEITNLTSIVADNCTSACAVLQKLMTDEERQLGRVTAMRSQAIRDAKNYIMNSAMAFDQDLFNEANRKVRGEAASKLTFEHGVSVSARRINDMDGLKEKKQFKRKSVTINNAPTVGYVVTMDEQGLKKVPIMNRAMRDKAETMVLEFAKVMQSEIIKIAGDPNDEKCLAALRAISKNMSNYGVVSTEVPEYTEEEKAKIAAWTDEIVTNYTQI